MTEAARPILRGESDVTLRKETSKPRRRPAAKAIVAEEDAPLLSALKAKRRALAEAGRVPAYVVFPDKTLIELAERRPETLDDMAGISGIGAKKLERYGASFLEVINGSAPEQAHPARRKLATSDRGPIYDRLLAAQAELHRGIDGTEKPLRCSAALLAKIARLPHADAVAVERLLGDAYAERFAAAFCRILEEA